MSKTDKLFLILSLLGLCLEVLISFIAPGQSRPLETAVRVVIYLVVACSVILSWISQRLSPKAVAVAEGVRSFLILVLMAFVFAENVPAIKAWGARTFHYVQNHSTLLLAALSTLALVLLAFAFLLLKNKRPMAWARAEILVAILVCGAAATGFVHDHSSMKVPDLLAAVIVLAAAFADYQTASKR